MNEKRYQSGMVPWASWLVRHKLRWILYAIFITAIPFIVLFVIGKNIYPFCLEIKDWIVSDWQAIGKEKS